MFKNNNMRSITSGIFQEECQESVNEFLKKLENIYKEIFKNKKKYFK